MSTTRNDSITALICPCCGAPLPEQAALEAAITCRHCGLTFRAPRPAGSRSASVSIQSGGQVCIGGHVIAGDLFPADDPADALGSNEGGSRVSIRAGSGVQIDGDLVAGSCRVVRREAGK
jgi:hypothetical protein